MANTATPLARGAFATASATLYTVPSATAAIVTEIVLTNTAAVDSTATITLNGVVFLPAIAVPANGIVQVGCKQVLAATQTITGFASATTTNFHLAGVQVA